MLPVLTQHPPPPNWTREVISRAGADIPRGRSVGSYVVHDQARNTSTQQQ